MQITSLAFVLLTIASIIIFYLIKSKYRVGYLALLSSIFIASYSYQILIYVLFYASVNYFIGLKMQVAQTKTTFFRLGIVFNLLQLLLLRYSSFAIDPVLSIFSDNLSISRLSEIIVPIGISYFTLQGIGYLINIKMGWEKPENRFLPFMLYIVFFPKFLSGPVERSNHFLPQLKKDQQFDARQVEEGLRIALFGFFKKIAIANQIAPYVINAYSDIDSMSGNLLWIMLLIGPLYIYFDFSGYTDIAIGIARALGIELLPNFNRPFFSENVTTFWKRFHISLSSWFNDYVFRQTSFKYRKWGIYASIFALLVTWSLFGIWHGAGWNFMVLGFVQALAIIYEFTTKKWRIKAFSNVPERITTWFGRICTYLFYAGSLVFFYSPSLGVAFKYFTKLADIGGPLMLGPVSRAPYSVFIYIPVLLILELLRNDYQNTYSKLETYWYHNTARRQMLRWTLYSLMIVLVLIVGQKGEQFIYVNF